MDASAIEQEDVDDLRSLGLSDQDVTAIVYAVAARLFFTAVLDGLGAHLDPATAQKFDPGLLTQMLVGRSVGT